MESPTDEQLMARVMAGDSQALSALVERHHSPLLGYLYRMTGGNSPLSEDLVQETFLRLLQQQSYQRGRPFKAWLYAIATNLARDQFRSPAQHRTDSFDEPFALELRDPAPGPEDTALFSEQGRAVALALAQLGEEQRVTLLLRFYNGLSLHEIAAALGVPLGTVKSRLSVGTHRLRALLIAVNAGIDA